MIKKREKELESEESERFEVEEVREALAKEIGPIDPAELFRALSDARDQKARLIRRPRKEVDPDRPLKRDADIDSKGVSVTKANAPRGSLTFGSTKQFFRVETKLPFRSAILRFKIPEKNVSHLHQESIVASRWDEQSKRLYPIPLSGYNPRFGYAFSQITEPGLYTAFGLPRDPRVMTTLHLLRALRPWAPLDSDGKLLPKVCGLILCSPRIMKAF